MEKKILSVALSLLLVIANAGTAFGAQDLESVNNFDVHYHLAHQYITRADFDLAEVELEQALIRRPQSRKAHRDYMFTSLMHLNFPQAVAEFMIVVGLGKAIPLNEEEQKQLDQDTAKLHYRKAIKYGEQNKIDREIFELRWANYYVPNNVTIMRSLAFALANSAMTDEAEKIYKDSFSLSSGPSTEEAYAHADFAYLLGKMSRQNEAIQELNKAISIDPKSPALHTDLAWFLEAKGDIVNATKEIEKAIDLAPNYLVGNVEVPSGTENFFGLPMLTLHTKLPIYSNAGLWTKLAKLLDKQNKISEAKKAYERALQLDPQQDDIKRRLSELQKSK